MSLILTLFMALQAPVIAGQVKLAWDAVPEATGYKMYVGTASRAYGNPVTLGLETTWTFSPPGGGTYYFAVTAFNAAEESTFSNEVSATITTGPRITSVGVMNITTTTAYVAWTTDPECSGLVQIGVTPDLGRSVTANNLATTDHAVIVGSLVTRTHYFYKVVSVCSGTAIQSTLRSFNTK